MTLFILFSYCTFRKEDIIHSAHLRRYSLRFEHLPKLCEILLPGRNVLFYCIYLFHPLFISVGTCGYLFYTLGCHPILPYFGLHFVPVLAIGSPFWLALCPFEILSSFCIFAPVLLSGIFPTPVIELVISRRLLNSFYWTKY